MRAVDICACVFFISFAILCWRAGAAIFWMTVEDMAERKRARQIRRQLRRK